MKILSIGNSFSQDAHNGFMTYVRVQAKMFTMQTFITVVAVFTVIGIFMSMTKRHMIMK